MASSNRSRARQPEQAGDMDLPPLDNDVPAPSYRQNDYRFEVQALFEIQKLLGEMKSAQDGMRDGMKANHDVLKSSIDGVKSKVDDLVALKNKIIGGAVALGVAATFLGFILGKASDYIQIKIPAAASTATPPAPQPLSTPTQQPSARRP